MQELAAADVRQQLEGIRIPYHILQGRHDLTTATPLVEEFVRQAGAPSIDLEVYERSSHMPSGEDLEKILHHIVALAREDGR